MSNRNVYEIYKIPFKNNNFSQSIVSYYPESDNYPKDIFLSYFWISKLC